MLENVIWVEIFGGLLSFVSYLDIQISPQIWKVLYHYLFKKLSAFFCSLRGSLIMHGLFSLIVFHSSHRLSSLFHFFFLCRCLDHFKSLLSCLTESSFCFIQSAADILWHFSFYLLYFLGPEFVSLFYFYLC